MASGAGIGGMIGIGVGMVVGSFRGIGDCCVEPAAVRAIILFSIQNHFQIDLFSHNFPDKSIYLRIYGLQFRIFMVK